MRKAICSITGKVLDCKNCKAINKTTQCPIWMRDNQLERACKLTRKVVEDEFKNYRKQES